MNNIYFTSDTHFGHRNVIKFDGRPFETIEEHDAQLVLNWNSVVKPTDIVYHLGDFALCNDNKAEEIMGQLQGQVNYILGNHDGRKLVKRLEKYFNVIGSYYEITIDNQLIIMCHYAFGVWKKSHKGSWNLHGHSHGSYPARGKQLDVGINCHNYFPISFESIKKHMDGVTLIHVDHHDELTN